ncbi:unnamed protein product [Rhodiola kirilowii]
MADATASAAPRFAPEDPTLPKPWKGLIDGNTGYLYFWNPETNATQYERPTSQPYCAALPDGNSQLNGSLVQGQQPSHGPRHDSVYNNDSYGRPNNGTGAGSHQNVGGGNLPANRGIIGDTMNGVGPVTSASGSHAGSFRYNHANNAQHPSTTLEPSGHLPQDIKKDSVGTTGITAASTSSAPRYAPEDPTLPKPWKGLIDGNTGYLYFWNPETNVTIYERPTSHPESTLSLNGNSHPTGSLVQGQKPSHSSNHGYVYNEAEPRFGTSSSGFRSSENKNFGNGNVPANHALVGDVMKSQVLTAMVDGPAAENYRRHHEITVSGVNVPHPFISFDSTGLPFEILHELKSAGFGAPTPIQAQSWPIALQSRDIVAVAKTGSGKTLGYLIPGFIHIKHCRKNSRLGPTVLVLSPTRELATQIQDEAGKFGKSSRISCTCLYGGAPKGPQLRDLDRGADIVVATPGRLNDILEMKRISLSQVSYLVLDEADRMLDMGFEPQIRKIVKEIPARRQTLMYTATWPKEVRKIAADLLVNPVQVNIGNIDELVANKSITQHVEVVPPMEKQRRLEQILRSHEPGSKIIIFCSTKKMCDMLSRNIGRLFGAAAIHGDKSQGERDFVLNQFRSGKSPILVATDVAARGLDVKDIRVVVNFDFPTGVEDYVHRIGRTGRAGATGIAHTFFCDQDAKHAGDLIKVLEGANQRIPPELREMALRGGGMMGKSRGWIPGPGGRDSGYGGGGGRGSSGYGGYAGRGDSGYGGGRGDSRYGGRHGGSGGGTGDRAFAPSGPGWDGRAAATGRGFGNESRSRDCGGYDRGRDRDYDANKYKSQSRSRSRSRSCSRDRFNKSSRSPVRSYHR